MTAGYGPRYLVLPQDDLFGRHYRGWWYRGGVPQLIELVLPQPHPTAVVAEVLGRWPNAERVNEDGSHYAPPLPPRTSGSETSKAAAEHAAYSADTQKGRIYAYLVSVGRAGANNHELATALDMPIQSVSTRTAQMRADGTITYAGFTKPGQFGDEQEVHIAVMDGTPAGQRSREIRSARYERLGDALYHLLIRETKGDSDLVEVAAALRAWEQRDATT